MDWFVYVIVNAARIAYTGIATDVTARLAQHNGEKRGGAKFTRGRGPWRVAHVEGPMAKGDALKREAAIKKDRRFKNSLKAPSPIRRTP
jgi:putative endonuclease